MVVNSNDQLLSFWAAVAFSINFNIGAGLLALPFAFYRAGWILSFITLIIVCNLSFISCLFILEAMARAPVYQNFLINSNSKEEQEPFHRKIESEKLIILERKFEFPEICSLYLGEMGMYLYALVVVMLFYGTLASYVCLFSVSVGSRFAFLETTRDNFYFYMLVFAVAVIPLSCLELHEQAEWQIFLTFARVFTVLAMIITVVTAWIASERSHSGSTAFTDLPNAPYGSPFFSPADMYQMIPIVFFANSFQPGI